MTLAWQRRLRWLLLACGLLPGIVLASESCSPCGGCVTLEQIRHMSMCEIEQLYTQAEAGRMPVGRLHGRLLALPCDRLPRIKVGVANTVWRGKVFGCEGNFCNWWVGFRAICSQAVYGPSWYDGKPCIVMEYAPGTPLFANMHDEIREVSPGVYVGLVYERFPCPKFRGYIAFEMECCPKPSCGP